jgi:hypothetical protein
MLAVLIGGILWCGAAFGQAGNFTLTGSLNTARSSHTATKLNNGLILIAGGISGGTVLSSAELYNPLTGTSTDTGNMISARELGTATLLTDGTVLITGGYNGSTYLNAAEIYNPTSGSFTAITNMRKERADHTATLLTNGTVLLDGGCNINCFTGNSGGYLNNAEIYTPSTKSFAFTSGNMHKERASHTATLLSNGEVLIAAGYNCTGCFLNTAELYNPTSQSFAYTTGDLVTARAYHTATPLGNGKVLIAGGLNSSAISSAELYNPATGTFTATGSLHAARELFTATLLGDGTVLVAGGYNLSAYLASSEIYNPTAGTFTPSGNMATARDNQTATALNNGTVFVTGGYNGTSLASSEIFSNLLVGYVDPRFVVVGVTYAPPGPSTSTFVSYQNSTMIGSTQSLSNSFMTGDSASVSLSYGFNVPMVESAKITDTYATTSNQTTKNTTAVTVNFQTTTAEKTFGTSSYFAPVNNDYDTVWVWLNPAVIFSISPNGALTWNGYGLDKTDQPGMDIVGIELGYLDGHFGAIPPDIQTSLNRTWAAKQIFAAGQGPALTSADLAQIAAFDPFSVSTYGPNNIGPNPPSPTTPDFRFTISSCTAQASFNYVQAAPSQAPAVYSCTLAYTNTSTQSQDITTSYSQMFSVDEAFTGSPWLLEFGVELKASSTLTWTTEEQNSITQSTTSTGALSVQGPPCNNVNQGVGPCVPVYDQMGNEPVQFYIYQDNMFGTFMFAPVDYY